MVFRGFVTAWRLAICPTRRSPFSVNPTMDGVVLPPSLLGTTWGDPPSITATQQLVVPRSIPMTFPMACAASSNSRLSFSGRLALSPRRDPHQGRAEQMPTKSIALAEFLEHDALFKSLHDSRLHRLVKVGIEALPHCPHLFQTFPGEDLQHLLDGQGDALAEGDIGLRGSPGQGALEIIDDGQETLEDGHPYSPLGFLPLLLHPLPCILEFRLLAQQHVVELLP